MPVHSVNEFVEKLAKHPDGFTGLFHRMSYVPLLPLLELPRQDVAEGLRQAFIDSSLSNAEFERVSLRDLVVFGLGSPSDHWTSLAVRWLADGFPIDETIVHAGDEMVTAKRGTQRQTGTLYFDSSDDMNRALNHGAPARGPFFVLPLSGTVHVG